MACHKCHQLRHWAVHCPGDPRASRSSANLSLTMTVWQDWSGPLQPAHLSQIIIMGLEPRVQQDVAGRSKNFLVDTGLPTLSLPPTPEPSPPKLVPFGVLQEKTITKRFTWALLCCLDGQNFPTSFWWSLSVLLPYWEEINLSLLLKSCSYHSPDRRCFKTLSWGQTIFSSYQMKQLLNGRSHL